MMTCSKELITHVETIEHCLSERNIKLSAGILPQSSQARVILARRAKAPSNVA
jgi:hypothetical protein